METTNTKQPQEIVLTYRETDRIKPIELRYERELPADMRRRLFPEAPALKESTPVWEKPRKRRGWKRLLVGLVLLAALIGLGVGIWLWNESRHDPSPEPPAGTEDGGQNEMPELPDGDDYYYWYEEDFQKGETTIDTYRPMGVDKPHVVLTLAPQGAQPLAPGEIYALVAPSTVTVLGYESEDAVGASIGTGVIFHADGYILTNYHVIAGCALAEVWITNEYGVDTLYDALLVGGDEAQDIAVLKIEASGLPAAELGVSDELKIGDPVYAIGNPLGVELRSTFTDGIVSAATREVTTDGVTMTLIQTNTALNSGNSGGPLINQYGQVVGVNTLKMMSDYDTIEGLGFAIPTSYAVRWINEIIEDGEIDPTPVLGISVMRIPEQLPDGTSALLIESVVSGSSGDKAGVKAGDYVVEFNGQRVYTTEDILRIRRDLRIGDRVVIRLWRDGEYLDLVMTMMADTSQLPRLPAGK